MKDVIFFVSFVLLANLRDAESRKMSFDEVRESLKPVRLVCMKKVGVDPKLIDQATTGNFVQDRKLMCYFKCMLINMKVMSKDDDILTEIFIRNMEHMLLDDLVDAVLGALRHCAPIIQQKIEGCRLAYEMSKCYYDYDPALSFYP